MCRKLLLAGTLFFGAIGYAQVGTNPVPTLTTNTVVAAASYRVVTGQLYNIQRSVLWSNFIADYVQHVPDGILVQPFELRPIYTNYTTPGGTVGRFFFGDDGKIKIRDEKILWRPIVLRNYPAGPGKPVAGRVVSVRAMKVGTSEAGGESYELWDCGAPQILRVVRTNSIRSSLTN